MGDPADRAEAVDALRDACRAGTRADATWAVHAARAWGRQAVELNNQPSAAQAFLLAVRTSPCLRPPAAQAAAEHCSGGGEAAAGSPSRSDVAGAVAGAAGLEPTTCGFGDRRSTG